MAAGRQFESDERGASWGRPTIRTGAAEPARAKTGTCHETPGSAPDDTGDGLREADRRERQTSPWVDPALQFELLYEREREYVYRTIRGIVRTETEVEDLVQDCFTGAYRARHRYRPDAPPGAWLHRIAVNTAISHLRRRRQERPLPLRTEIPVADRGLEQAEVRATLEEAIAGLSPKVRAAVVLQHFEDRSRDEIAVALGIPAGTVSSRVANGMALLRSRVGVDDMTAAMSHAPTVSTPQSLPGPSSVSGAGRATHRARSPQERNAEAVGW